MEKKNKTPTEKIQNLLNYLVEIQSKTAPVELSIGYVDEDNQVNSNVLVIKECPPFVFDIVASWKEVNKEMVNGGLLISADY